MIATKGDLPDWDETLHGSCKRKEWELQEALLEAKQRIKELEYQNSKFRAALECVRLLDEAERKSSPKEEEDE